MFCQGEVHQGRNTIILIIIILNNNNNNNNNNDDDNDDDDSSSSSIITTTTSSSNNNNNNNNNNNIGLIRCHKYHEPFNLSDNIGDCDVKRGISGCFEVIMRI